MAAKHILSARGRNRANDFLRELAKFHGVPDAGQEFSIDPARMQELQALTEQEGQTFLDMVSVIPKTQMKGDVIFIGKAGLTVSRTDTTNGDERTPKAAHGKTKNTYDMGRVENDVAITYDEIDQWAVFPNMFELWGSKVRSAIADDRLRVGWYGESMADSTDPTGNPNGEDILPGWLHQIRTYNSGSQYTDGSGGAVVLGSEGELGFPTLDYLVSVARGKVDIVYRRSPDLVALISENLVSHEEQMYYRIHGRKPEQKLVIMQNGELNRSYGGLPCYAPPFFPDGTVLVTSLDNLHLYFQDSSVRRSVRDYPPRNQFEDFNSRNECYAVGDYRKTSLVDGITVDEAIVDIMP